MRVRLHSKPKPGNYMESCMIDVADGRRERDSAQPKLLETILYRDNLNRAYKRVKANKGAAGVGGMTIEEALPYLKEHQWELINRILRGKYTPSPVRVEIPKPDNGVRKLGIPTVIDRTIQQAITQQLVSIYEPLFAENSYGYRPNRSAKDAIIKVKAYGEQGYTLAVVLDLSKCFDTLNHEILINLLRRNIKEFNKGNQRCGYSLWVLLLATNYGRLRAILKV